MTNPRRDWLALVAGIAAAAMTGLALRDVLGDEAPPGSMFLSLLFAGLVGALAAAWVAPTRRWPILLGLALIEAAAARSSFLTLARGGVPDAAQYAVATAFVAVALATLLIGPTGPNTKLWARWTVLAIVLVVAFAACGAVHAAGSYVLAAVERDGIPELDRNLELEVVGGKGSIRWDPPTWDARAPIARPHVRLTGFLDHPETRIDISAGGFRPPAKGRSRLDGLDVSFTLDIALPEPLTMVPVRTTGDDPVYSVRIADHVQDEPVQGTLKQLLLRAGIRRDLVKTVHGFTATYRDIKCQIHGLPGSPGGPTGPTVVERITITGSGTYVATVQ